MTNLQYYQETLSSKFHFIGRGANDGHWRSSPKGCEPYEVMIDIKKVYGGKNFAAVQITLCDDKEYGIWMKVEYWLPSYCEWSTHFEGHLETKEDIHHVLRMVGLE